LGFRGLGGGPIATGFGALLLRQPADSKAAPGQLEFKAYFGEHRRRQIAAHLGSFALVAGGLAIEGEADGVEDGGLARAGGAVDEKERVLAQIQETDGLGAGKGAEGDHGQR